MATFTNVTPDEILDKLDVNEKKELFELLCKDFQYDVDKEIENLEREGRVNQQVYVTEHLRNLSPFELKKLLVNIFYVPSYYDDDALRKALEPIITAR